MNLFSDANYYLKEVAKYNWNDPNPKPVIEHLDKHKVYVVRDDLLGYGSKARFIDCLIKNTHADEWVYGGSTKVGYGPISLAYVCSRYGKKATVFAAARKIPTEQQKKAIEYGCNYVWVEKMGMLAVTIARARDYWQADPNTRMILPMGLEHPLVFGSIIKVARDAIPTNVSEIWTVGGSGTLSRGLQLAFPTLPVNLVQVGHKLTEREIGRAKLYISEYKYDQPTKVLPPYPSAITYDAKVWEFVIKHAKPNALIWNVA